MHDTFTSTMVRQLDLATEVAPAFKAALPSGGELTRELTIAARLINANIGLRVLDVSRGGFDTHDSQNNSLPGLLTDLNAGLQAFYATLSPVVPQPGDDHDACRSSAARWHRTTPVAPTTAPRTPASSSAPTYAAGCTARCRR